ncbi:hypothetical protein Nepgr_028626 [Nepenthes gracilis]|uniref:Uncharacterized protein n=1 Tax=Nepenthes gracilis TaxID=150966 RepID=A0AAD3TCP6_NEPGR|nr:hypothetical protein Nepgr_028626 [Nepenthes gracilis]
MSPDGQGKSVFMHIVSDAICPGCKEPYKHRDGDIDEKAVDSIGNPLTLPPAAGMSKMERRFSLIKYTQSGLMRSHMESFGRTVHVVKLLKLMSCCVSVRAHNRGGCLRQRVKEGSFGNDSNDGVPEPAELLDKLWRPVTRKLKTPAAVISLY